MEHEERVRKRADEVREVVKKVGITQLAFDGIPSVIDKRYKAAQEQYVLRQGQAETMRAQGSPMRALEIEREARHYQLQAHLLSGGYVDPEMWAEAEITLDEHMEKAAFEALGWADKEGNLNNGHAPLTWTDHWMVCRSRVVHNHRTGVSWQGAVHLVEGIASDSTARYNAMLICLTTYIPWEEVPQFDGVFHSVADAKAWVAAHIWEA